MTFQGLMIIIAGFALLGCASTSSVTSVNNNSNSQAKSASAAPVSVVAENAVNIVAEEAPPKKTNNNFLICKAKKNRFHYDWDASSLAGGQNDQNSIRFEFREARRPAGDKGENLKVGECGWAGEALARSKKTKSQVTFKSLSDEVAQSFYKLKTGKVFKVPVRQTRNGMMAAPGTGVRVIR